MGQEVLRRFLKEQANGEHRPGAGRPPFKARVKERQLLRMGDVRRMTGLSYTLLDRLVRSGLLPFKRFSRGGPRYFLPEEVEKLFYRGYDVKELPQYARKERTDKGGTHQKRSSRIIVP